MQAKHALQPDRCPVSSVDVKTNLSRNVPFPNAEWQGQGTGTVPCPVVSRAEWTTLVDSGPGTVNIL